MQRGLMQNIPAIECRRPGMAKEIGQVEGVATVIILRISGERSLVEIVSMLRVTSE